MEDYDDGEDYGEEEDGESDAMFPQSSSGGGDEDEDYGYECGNDVEDEDPVTRIPQTFFTLSEAVILQRQAEAVNNVSTVLSVSKEDAGLLLRHFKWSINRVHDEWFQDEIGVRKAVGLLRPNGERSNTSGGIRSSGSSKQLTCGICFDERESMIAPACGVHFFCESCWQGYIGNSISEGPGCLSLRCPDPSCFAAVGELMVLQTVQLSPDLRAKYRRYMLRSYVEDNTKAKWCPAPGCEYAVEYVAGSSSFDIFCECGHMFCYNCLEEAHRPVECETVGKWILKNSAESENMNWILANSKPCPKCKRPIEKNQGCMHMSCTPPCKFEFCWLCLGAWSEHGERTGGFYACNRYETAKNEGVYDEAERRREMAKNSLERYTHYYERWLTNEQSRKKALESLKEIQTKQIEELARSQCQLVSQLKFIVDALTQVVECRRVLKWTYAYGYYLPEGEAAKRAFFEYLQGEAEARLEQLHTCAEKDLSMFCSEPLMTSSPPTMNFNEFRTKLAGLTSVTHTYFENLVRALESGLADVEHQPTSVTTPKGGGAGAKGGGGGAAGSSKAAQSSKGRAGRSTRSGRGGMGGDDDD